MIKKKKEEKIEKEVEETIEEEKPKKQPAYDENTKFILDKFLKDYKQTSGKHNAYAAGFKVWFTAKDPQNALARNTMSEWKKLFEEFLSSPVK